MQAAVLVQQRYFECVAQFNAWRTTLKRPAFLTQKETPTAVDVEVKQKQTATSVFQDYFKIFDPKKKKENEEKSSNSTIWGVWGSKSSTELNQP